MHVCNFSNELAMIVHVIWWNFDLVGIYPMKDFEYTLPVNVLTVQIIEFILYS